MGTYPTREQAQARLEVKMVKMLNEGVCPLHSGVEKSLETVCIKLDLVEKSIQRQLDLNEKIFGRQFEMLERAIAVAKGELDIRLESMNEVRAQLTRQAAETITRNEVNLMLSKLEDKIGVNEKIVSDLGKSSSRGEGSSIWKNYIVTVFVSAFISFIFFLIAHTILKF